MKNVLQYTNIWEIKNVKKLNAWQEKIQKNIDTTAKLIALFVCIVSMAAIGLKAIFCKSRNTEEAKQPLDFEKPRWNDLDWTKWIENNRDNWS